MAKYVYDFAEGDRHLADLLGGKGANLAEMTRIGLPVPPGFTITTRACRQHIATGGLPDGLERELAGHLSGLETAMDKRLGDSDDPLLVSVRSGASVSMPGMMDTVLNVGLNDDSVRGLARQSGSDRFAWDTYRRLVQMFGDTVLGVPADVFGTVHERLKRDRSVVHDTDLDAGALRDLTREFQAVIRERTGREFPQDPSEQLRLAVDAVFDSWNSPRAAVYRRRERIPADLGTAVSVVSMVFGNRGEDSGTGVAFTRDPATGAQGVYGDFLPNAQGEDVVAGIRNTLPLSDLEHIDRKSYEQLLENMTTLERHYRDLCDIEFTIERGTLWMLQTRVGKRTAAAAFVVAAQLVDEGLIDADEALRRVSGGQLAQLMFPHFDTAAGCRTLATGVNASPGAATGRAVFDSATAVERAAAGEDVILVRRETNPDDLDGMIAATGILTGRGGRTSHAAVVARGMGKTCVCGADQLDIDVHARRLTGPDGESVEEGDVLSVDGSNGCVYLGEVPVVPSPVMRYFEGSIPPDHSADALVRCVDRTMSHADSVRRLAVRANADTADDAVRARRFGATGIGLCRTEHMFLGERRPYIERMILAETDAEREQALAELEPFQRQDFAEILTAMDGLPVTIRLVDPPLHEFLPDPTELSVRVALADERGEDVGDDRRLLAAVNRIHEQNPMLGLRGARLGIVVPGLFAMQVAAILEAAVRCGRAGGEPHVEIMIPLVGAVQELQILTEEAHAVARRVLASSEVAVDYRIGTMIELPRAALTAGAIAEEADFFSFGTNDLTQTVWGFSRDDVEPAFFPAYLDKGVFGVSPFESIDREGVGRLIRIAVAEARQARPGIGLGVCGEHGGDPESVHFFEEVGLDYVSCSPYRIPVARLEAGRAVLAVED